MNPGGIKTWRDDIYLIIRYNIIELFKVCVLTFVNYYL